MAKQCTGFANYAVKKNNMCEFGNEVILLVPMPSNLSYTGEFRWAEKGIDGCIAPIVQALNDAGIYTANSCCGHGKEDGTIILHDGRTIKIINVEQK